MDVSGVGATGMRAYAYELAAQLQEQSKNNILKGKKMITEKDTICAIATGTGSAGIGIVRISGPDAISVAEKLFRGKRRLSELKTYTAAYGHLIRYGAAENERRMAGEPSDAETAKKSAVEIENKDGARCVGSEEEILDEVIALVMRAPHTFTTEDVVELSCHGGPLVQRRVLEALVAAGARLAEPGEFTKRAYLGGRIDLSEAEAVMDVIAAENERALDASLRQLRGSLKKAVFELREKLLYETAFIESALDDPENYSLDGYSDRMRAVLKECGSRIRELIDGAEDGRMLRQGIRTAIVGRPNAGKSSILNLLLGEERAIVTEIAGTTRDTLEEKAILGGVQLVLIDTAGIRETADAVEQIGVQRAKAAVETADLILLVIDAAEPLTEEDRELLRSITGAGTHADRTESSGSSESGTESARTAPPLLVLLNKNDLDTVVTSAELEEFEPRIKKVLEISAATGDGRDRLSDAVQELFFSGKLSDSQEQYLLNARHKEALQEALHALKRVENSVDEGVGEDFYTIDLLAAYEALGRITGETLEDDLADKIFAEFCMGK